MSLDSNLTRYSVKDYYLNAGLCYLALPVSSADLEGEEGELSLSAVPLD